MMDDYAIELRNASLDFPMVRGSQKVLDIILEKLSISRSGSDKSVTRIERGISEIEWAAIRDSECYRVIIRNEDLDTIVSKIEVLGTKHSFDWNTREVGVNYRYRVQFRKDSKGDWIDIGAYQDLVRPEPREVRVDENENSNPSYKKSTFRAIDGVSLSIKKGEVIGIIGENGSGKSTLLRLIGGVYAPDIGEVETRGKVTMLISVGAGFENHLSGRENIMISGSMYGVEHDRLEEMLPAIVEYSGINRDFVDQPLRTYSSGMRSRLGFSIISHLEPEILLLDEVMSAGDHDFRKRSEKRILEMVEGDATVVIVSHDVNILERLCDRVFAMKEGKIVTDGGFDQAVSVYRS
tara:strand:+ start:672 stop:1724 length:1053 start_codon:yes stop_codon:yes gene_type:complete